MQSRLMRDGGHVASRLCPPYEESRISISYLFLFTGLRFSMNAAMPSARSSSAKVEWNRLRSTLMPSDNGVSNARLMASLAMAAAGRDIVGDLFRRSQRLFHQFVRRHDAADEAGAFGFRGVHHAPGEAQIHRLGFADRARQPLGAADARDGAERDFRLAEFGGVGSDDDVAHHGELAAAAERIAADGGDGGFAARGDAAAADRGEIAGEHVDEAFRLHLLDVGAGGKRLFAAGEQDTADIVIGLEVVDGRRDFAKHAER